MQVPDDDPLQGLTTHSDEWWEAVYRAYGRAAYLGAQSVLRRAGQLFDAAEIEDLVQTTYLEIFESKGIDDSTKSIPAVFYRRAQQRALDRVKRQGRTADGELSDVPEIDDGFDDVDLHDMLQRAGAIAWDNQHKLSPREQRVWSALRRGEPHHQIASREGISRVRVTQMSTEIPKKVLRGHGILPDERRGD